MNGLNCPYYLIYPRPPPLSNKFWPLGSPIFSRRPRGRIFAVVMKLADILAMEASKRSSALLWVQLPPTALVAGYTELQQSTVSNSSCASFRRYSMNTNKEGHWIYRKSIRTKSGKIIYASHYGKKAFRIFIKAA